MRVYHSGKGGSRDPEGPFSFLANLLSPIFSMFFCVFSKSCFMRVYNNGKGGSRDPRGPFLFFANLLAPSFFTFHQNSENDKTSKKK